MNTITVMYINRSTRILSGLHHNSDHRMKHFLHVLCDLWTSVQVSKGLSHIPALHVTLAHNVCSKDS